MPFVRRKVEPLGIRRQHKNEGLKFEEYDDVSNHALVNVLLQLSSITFHAADLFREIEDEFQSIYRRCNEARVKLEKLYDVTLTLNPKEVSIPMSDLGTEEKIPLHLHYKSCNPIEEEFFTVDARSPCVIHLHQTASPDLSRDFRNVSKQFTFQVPATDGSNNLPSPSDNKSVRSSTNDKCEDTRLSKPNSYLPTPEEKIKQECSPLKAEIITIDTSGEHFERRTTFRRSQRSSMSALRRRSMLKYKNNRASMSVMDSSSYTDQSRFSRPNSALSSTNSNSSFTGRHSVGRNTESPRHMLNVTIQTKQEVEKISAAQKSPDNIRIAAASIAATLPASPIPDAHNHVTSTTLNNHVTKKIESPRDKLATDRSQTDQEKHSNMRLSVPSDDTTRDKKRSIVFNGNSSIRAEHRISSGFCSGSERLSTTSEILLQHHHVNQALQQILSKSPQPLAEKSNKISGDESDDSTLSISSQLSALQRSSAASSFLSIDLSSSTPRLSNSSIVSANSEHKNSTPAAGKVSKRCSFSNPLYEYHHRSSFDSSTKTPVNYPPQSLDNEVFWKHNSKSHVGKLENTKSVLECVYPETPQNTPHTVSVFHALSGISSTSESAAALEKNYFFGPNFDSNKSQTEHKSLNEASEKEVDCLQVELNQQFQKTELSPRKPAPPRRTSSLKKSRDSPKNVLPYMEPLSTKVVERSSSVHVAPTESKPNTSGASSFKHDLPVSNNESRTGVGSIKYLRQSEPMSSSIDRQRLSLQSDSVSMSLSSVSSSPLSSCDNLTLGIDGSIRKSRSLSHRPKKPLRTKLLENKALTPSSSSSVEAIPNAAEVASVISASMLSTVTSRDNNYDTLSSSASVSTTDGGSLKLRHSDTKKILVDQPISVLVTELDQPIKTTEPKPDEPISALATKLDQPIKTTEPKPKPDQPISVLATKLDQPIKTTKPKPDQPISVLATKLDQPIKTTKPKPDQPISVLATKLDQPIKTTKPKPDQPISVLATKLDQPIKTTKPKPDQPISALGTKLDQPIKTTKPKPDQPISALGTKLDQPIKTTEPKPNLDQPISVDDSKVVQSITVIESNHSQSFISMAATASSAANTITNSNNNEYIDTSTSGDALKLNSFQLDVAPKQNVQSSIIKPFVNHLPFEAKSKTSSPKSDETSPKEKPLIKPKPKSFYYRPSKNEPEKSFMKKNVIKQRTASARAAFFGLPSPVAEQKETANVVKTKSSTDAHVTRESISVEKTSSLKSFAEKSPLVSQTSNNEVSTQSRRDAESRVSFQNSDDVKRSAVHTVTSSISCPPTTDPKIESADAPNHVDLIADILSSNTDGKNSESKSPKTDHYDVGEETHHKIVPEKTEINTNQNNQNDSLSSISSSSLSPRSPISTPVSASSKTEESSTSSLSNSPRYVSSNSTSAQNFKSLLLQNYSRSPSSSVQTNVTPKLHLNTLRENRFNSSPASNRIMKMSDLRAALYSSKHGRRVKQHSERPKSFVEPSRSPRENASFKARREGSRMRPSSVLMNVIPETESSPRYSTNVTDL